MGTNGQKDPRFSRRYNAAQRDRVVELRKSGLSYGAISQQTGMSRDTIAWWCKKAGLGRLRSNGVSQANGRREEKKRNCLCCRKPFLSEWSGNRICAGCKRMDSRPQLNTVAPFDIFGDGKGPRKGLW